MPNHLGWNERLTALNGLLAELYKTADESRRVVSAAGLSPSLIKFHDAAAINWLNILDATRTHGRVDDIVRVALKDFPEHEILVTMAGPADAGTRYRLVPSPEEPDALELRRSEPK